MDRRRIMKQFAIIVFVAALSLSIGVLTLVSMTDGTEAQMEARQNQPMETTVAYLPDKKIDTGKYAWLYDNTSEKITEVSGGYEQAIFTLAAFIILSCGIYYTVVFSIKKRKELYRFMHENGSLVQIAMLLCLAMAIIRGNEFIPVILVYCLLAMSISVFRQEGLIHLFSILSGVALITIGTTSTYTIVENHGLDAMVVVLPKLTVVSVIFGVCCVVMQRHYLETIDRKKLPSVITRRL